MYDAVYQKEYRERNKGKRKLYNKKHREQNQEHYNQLAKNWRDNNPNKKLFISSKYRAKKQNIEFNLDLEDVIIPDLCPVFKVPMIVNTEFAPSLDKINPELGYVKGNVQVISRKANIMKHNATKEQLEQFANWVLS